MGLYFHLHCHTYIAIFLPTTLKGSNNPHVMPGGLNSHQDLSLMQQVYTTVILAMLSPQNLRARSLSGLVTGLGLYTYTAYDVSRFAFSCKSIKPQVLSIWICMHMYKHSRYIVSRCTGTQ